MPTATPIQFLEITIEQGLRLRLEGVDFMPHRADDGTLLGWKAGLAESAERVGYSPSDMVLAPPMTFHWVPHERATWPWRYATLKKPLTLRVWNQRHPVEENTTERIVPPGATVKVVMVSRLGHVGFTDDLMAEQGYHVRLSWEEIGEYCENRRSEP